MASRPVITLPATARPRPGAANAAMAALSGGTLTGGTLPGGQYCVWLADRGEVIPVIWPYGYSARLDPLEILDRHGTVLAREGDLLIVGGGQISADPDRPCGLGQDHAFVISTISEVRRA